MSYDKSEPMKAPWFSWSPEGGFEFHATAAEARRRAEDELEAEREDAPDGWSEWVDEICWGRAYGCVTETERRPRTEEDWHVTRDAEEVVDYALVDDVPQLSAEEIAALVECEEQLRAIKWDDACEYEGRIDASVYLSVDQLHAVRAAIASLDAARKGRA